MNEASQGPVAIIGGGPMGLAAAWALARAGVAVEVFEAGPVVGGMSATFDFDGTRIERYYHFICTPDQPLFELLDELGIADRLHWTHTRMGYYHQGRVHPWGDPIALLKFPGLNLWQKIRYGLLAFTSTKRNNWQGLDGVNAVAWLKGWLGDTAYRVLWQPLFELKFYHFTDNLSAAWIWTRIRRVGNSRHSLMKEKLGYMAGGSEVIMTALRDDIIARGGKVHLLARVDEVVVDDGQVKGVIVKSEKRAFDTVISTVPTPYVPRMIPQLPAGIRQQLESINNIAVVCVIVKLRKSVTDKFWLNIADPNMDIPGLVEYTRLNPTLGDEHIVYVPYYVPSEHRLYSDPDEVFFDKIRRYLKTINPELDDADFIALHASRYRHAQPICEPNFRDKLPPIDLPIQGLYAADTSYYYPEDRSISESVELGQQMARMVLDKQ